MLIRALNPAREAFMSDLNPCVPDGYLPCQRERPEGDVGAAVPEPSRSVPLRVSGNVRTLDTWALVLVSQGFQPLVLWLDGLFELHVPLIDMDAARVELDAFDAEERERERSMLADEARTPRPATRRAGLASACLSLLLLTFFAFTGPRAAGSAWFATGAADAEHVLHGEWWRTITALTLHADAAHVLSNVGVGALVVGAVMRSEGVGVGSALVLASGAAGNFINAWAHQTLHRSVGFSTAVFGAIGILGGLAYMQRRNIVHSRLPAWTALAGTLALLALLGTGGGRTDLLAHLFGALSGVMLGVFAGITRWHTKSTGAQWLTGFASAALIVAAWATALG
jgi:membrane associated rhomboid family serine protease